MDASPGKCTVRGTPLSIGLPGYRICYGGSRPKHGPQGEMKVTHANACEITPGAVVDIG